MPENSNIPQCIVNGCFNTAAWVFFFFFLKLWCCWRTVLEPRDSVLFGTHMHSRVIQIANKYFNELSLNK